MHPCDRERGAELGDEVAVGDGVYGVGSHETETEVVRRTMGVQLEGRSGQSSGTERRHVGPAERV